MANREGAADYDGITHATPWGDLPLDLRREIVGRQYELAGIPTKRVSRTFLAGVDNPTWADPHAVATHLRCTPRSAGERTSFPRAAALYARMGAQ